MASYVLIYKNEGKSWSASSPDYPKVFAIGCETRDEATTALTLAIQAHLQAFKA